MLYWLSYCRHSGKNVDECFTDIGELIKRKNILINEFGYSEIEMKISQSYK